MYKIIVMKNKNTLTIRSSRDDQFNSYQEEDIVVNNESDINQVIDSIRIILIKDLNL
jgi:hypothetical protein